MKRIKTHIALIILMIAGCKMIADNPHSLKSIASPELKMVFVNETDPLNKTVLKLYGNDSYEFLQFTKKKKALNANRELGEYKLKGSKLKLKSKAKHNHPDTYYYKADQGLYSSKKDLKSEKNSLLQISIDPKYNQPFYNDSIFGIISNNYKIVNKLKDPEFKPKPKAIVKKETKEEMSPPINDDTAGYKAAFEKMYVGDVTLSSDKLKQMKAVLVVGADSEGNKGFISELKELGIYLKKLGVKVTELYYPNCKWEDIKKAANGANIFVYAGHGTTLGTTGSIYINEGIISGDELACGLKLHKNALVIFNHACESAGSSAADANDIGLHEAVKRVQNYANPFMKMGAGCYYANNYNGSPRNFLTAFFNGKDVKTIYNNEASRYSTIAYQKAHPENKNYLVCVSTDKASKNSSYTQYTYENGKKTSKQLPSHNTYEVACVGKPTFTVNELLK